MIAATEPLPDTGSARAWLKEAGEERLADDLRVLARAVRAYRLVTADPYLPEVGRRHLLVARVGYGDGEEVAYGRWSDARELVPAPGPRRRARVLAPQAHLAAVLGNRERLLACQELALRARADLAADRPREAALQLLVCLDAALAELPADPAAEALGERIEELRTRREETLAIAQSALAGALSESERQDAGVTLERLESVLRARAVALG